MKMMVILLAVRLQRIINLDNLVAIVQDVNTKKMQVEHKIDQ